MDAIAAAIRDSAAAYKLPDANYQFSMMAYGLSLTAVAASLSASSLPQDAVWADGTLVRASDVAHWASKVAVRASEIADWVPDVAARASEVASAAAGVDYRKLLRLKPEAIDPGESGPLGPLWPEGEPGWFAKMQTHSESATPANSVRSEIRLSLATTGQLWLGSERHASVGLASYISGLALSILFMLLSIGPGWIGFLIGVLAVSLLISFAGTSFEGGQNVL